MNVQAPPPFCRDIRPCSHPMLQDALRQTTACLLALLLACPVPSPAATPAAEARAELMLKVLSFDRNLKKRSGDGIRIGLVYRSEDSNSVAEFNALGQALAARLDRRIAGLPLSIVGIDAASDELERLIPRFRLNVLYLCQGTGKDALPRILSLTRKYRVLSMTASSEYLEAGVAVGLGTSTTAPSHIHVQLAQSLAEGVQFDVEFIQRTEVLR